MEPLLNRMGGVTIERVVPEKKQQPQPPEDSTSAKLESDTESSTEDAPSEDDGSVEKREVEIENPISQEKRKNEEDDENGQTKRQKFEKPEESESQVIDDMGESEEDVEDFIDSENEEYDSSDESQSVPVKKKMSSVTVIDPEKSDFLEKLAQGPFLSETVSKSDSKSDTSEYDFDITEKLKEMGEISVQTVKKGEKPRKPEIEKSENEISVTPAKKDDSDSSDSDSESMGMEMKLGSMRRNIREVMDETKLDEATLAAQRQEMERLRRVQEQQRIIREVQRQIAMNRQNNKTQNKVISLLQGNSSLVKQQGQGSSGTSSANRIGSTVLVKLPNGETKPMTRVSKGQTPFELLRIQKGAAQGKVLKNITSMKRPAGNLTPSVSIAPVTKKVEIKPDPDGEGIGAVVADTDKAKKPLVKKGKDVVTISSDSDDDCIVLSEEEPEQPEPDEDPCNSGMHTNDLYNIPDEQGRVLVNVGHPEDEQDIFLAPQIARIIKPHQIGGIRFLFDNVVESIERFNTSTGFGCILAHSMGLGKTLQVVSFSDIFLRHTTAKNILCIMPINTLQNWVAEYNMWLPKEPVTNSPLLIHGEVRPRNFNIYVLNDSHKTLAARAKIIQEWHKEGGILLIGYEMFRLLSLKRYPKSKSKKKKPVVEPEIEDDDKNKELFDEIHEALVKPGADLVICDEGHRIKNSHASISQALKQIRTKRRVVLTGYPLQNNLLEYWCMVDFVRPNYLGTKTEFSNMFERPIQNGQCIDSTPQDIRLMRYRAHVLHSLLEGFVQRRSHSVLQVSLPQKEEYVLLVRMTEFQRKLYDIFMNEVVRTKTVPNPLKAFAVCCKIWNHPDVLYQFLKKRGGGEDVDIDLEEVASVASSGASPKKNSKPRAPPKKKEKKTPAKDKNSSSPNASIKPAASIVPNTTAIRENSTTDSIESSIDSVVKESCAMLESPSKSEVQALPSEQTNSFPNDPPRQTDFSQPPSNYPVPSTGSTQTSHSLSTSQIMSPHLHDQSGSMNSYQQSPQQNPTMMNMYQQHANSQSGIPAQMPQRSPGMLNSYGEPIPGAQASQNPYEPSGCQPFQQNSYGPMQNTMPVSHSQPQNTGMLNAYGQPPNASAPVSQPQQSPGVLSSYGQSPSALQPQQSSGITNTYSQQQNPGVMSPYKPPNASSSQSGATNPYDHHSQQNTGMMNPYEQPLSNAPTPVPQSQENPLMSPYGQQSTPNSVSQPPHSNQIVNPYDSNTHTSVPQNQPPRPLDYPRPVQSSTPQVQPMASPNNSNSLPPLSNYMPPQLPSKQAIPDMQQTPPSGQIQGQMPGTHSQQHSGDAYGQQSHMGVQPGPTDNRLLPPVQSVGAPGYVPPGISTREGQGTTSVPSTCQPLQQLEAAPPSVDLTSPGPHQNLPEVPKPELSQTPAPPPNSQTGQSDCYRQENQLQPYQQNYQQYPNTNDYYGQNYNQNYYNNGQEYGYYNNQKSNSYQNNYQQDGSNNYWQNSSYYSQNGTQNQYYKKADTANQLTDYSNTNNYYRNNQYNAGYNQNEVYPPNSQQQQEQQQPTPPQPPAPPYQQQNWPYFKQESKPDIDIKTENEKKPELDKTEDVKKEEPKEEKEDEKDEKPIIDEKDIDIKISDQTVAKVNVKEEDPGIPYDWAVELLKGYVPGCIENSAKMEVFFCILEESMALGDRILLFSQSLFTLNLIEEFLQNTNVPGTTDKWARSKNYYRLDGSTSALEREKLINEYNSNPNIHLFLVSTRAGSLGINLVGANRVVVFDASWNPCHDTQAVCRVYRYGQKKPCFVYRIVMDNCLEKKIYDRQINKQGMSDRVVDECNPDAHLSMKDVTNLCWDDEKDSEVKDFSETKDKYIDVVMQKVLDKYSHRLSKEPFQHESLLIDRKEKKLSQAEKRLAKRSYELEKQASINSRPVYNYYQGGHGFGQGLQIRAIRMPDGMLQNKPVASVRPMQAELNSQIVREPGRQGGRNRWIPAEVWQRRGMAVQEMTLPLDVVIPTNSANDRGNIVLKAGQKVLVLKCPKGVYMQLECGKIVAIKTNFNKMRGGKTLEKDEAMKSSIGGPMPAGKKGLQMPNSPKPTNIPLPLKNNSAITVIPKGGQRLVRPTSHPVAKLSMKSIRQPVPNLINRQMAMKNNANPRMPMKMQMTQRKVQLARTKPYNFDKAESMLKPNQMAKPETEKSMLEEEMSESQVDNFENHEESRVESSDEVRTDDDEPMKNVKKVNVNRNQSSADIQSQEKEFETVHKAGKNFRPTVPTPKTSKNVTSTSLALHQLEQTTTSINDNGQPFQETLDNITNSYPTQMEKEVSESEEQNIIDLDTNKDDEVEMGGSYVTEDLTSDSEGKTPDPNATGQDYNYGNYYGYNPMQPYPPAPQPYYNPEYSDPKTKSSDKAAAGSSRPNPDPSAPAHGYPSPGAYAPYPPQGPVPPQPYDLMGYPQQPPQYPANYPGVPYPNHPNYQPPYQPPQFDQSYPPYGGYHRADIPPQYPPDPYAQPPPFAMRNSYPPQYTPYPPNTSQFPPGYDYQYGTSAYPPPGPAPPYHPYPNAPGNNPVP